MKKFVAKLFYVGIVIIIAILCSLLSLNFTFKEDEKESMSFNDFVVEYNSLIDRYNTDLAGGLKISGVDIASSEDDMGLQNDYYQSMRLIVKSDSDNLPRLGASEIISGYDGVLIYQFDTIEKTIYAEKYLDCMDSVEYVDVDVKFEICESDSDGSSGGDYLTWGYDDMGVDTYIGYLNSLYTDVDDMTEVVVAVMDTGIDSDHSWFDGRIADGGCNFSSTTPSGECEYEDGHSHGTHVSGTIVDLTLPNVKILPIKVMSDSGDGYLYQIINGINHVISQKNAGQNIVAMNFSIGAYCVYGSTDFTSYANKINEAYEKGILSVVAAGNKGADVINYSPANVSNAITVAAVGELDNNEYYSPSWTNYGSYVDVCAPGVGINSAIPGGGFGEKSGTSMACPHVTALVSLMYSDNDKNYTPSVVSELLISRTIDLGSAGWDKYYGYGLVNIKYGDASLLSDVIFSRSEVECTEQFELTLSVNNGDGSVNTNAKIFYTLDGSTPTSSSDVYQNPIMINKETIVKAIAYEFDSAGNIIAYSRESSITYYFYDKDEDDAFNVSSDGVLLSYGGSLTDVAVPEKVGDITIVEIGEKAFVGKAIKSVSMSSTVTTIGRQAFDGVSTLTHVSAPGVTLIDVLAFNGCTSFQNLTNDNFPVLEQIGRGAFQNCTGLGSIDLNVVEFVDSFAFYRACSTGLTSVHMENVKSVADYAFDSCCYIEKIMLPNVLRVGTRAFYDNSLTIINLPQVQYVGNASFGNNNQISSISMPKCEIVGTEAFSNCSYLSEIDIQKVKKIGSRAFSGCSGLVELDMPNVVEINNGCFSGANNLTYLNLPKVKLIGGEGFLACYSLKQLILPSIEEIGRMCFYGAINLESVTLSAVVSYIDDLAFDNCKSGCMFYIYSGTMATDYVKENGLSYTLLDDNSILEYSIINEREVKITGYSKSVSEEIVIPGKINNLPVTQIAENAFADCEYIYSINLPYVTTIMDHAFEDCINLSDINCEQLIEVGDYSFAGCKKLKNIDIECVENIGDYSFYKCSSLVDIKLPKTLCSIGIKALGYNVVDNSEVLVDGFVIKGYSGNISESYAEENSIEFLGRFSNLTRYYYGVSEDESYIYIAEVEDLMAGNLILPSEYQPAGADSPLPIIAIAEYAFDNCSFITGVELPSSIVTIGDNAFMGCVSLKYINLNNITSIGQECFCACESLENVKLDKIIDIPSGAFSYCYNLKYIDLGIAENIGDGAFLYCERLEVVSGDCIKSIEKNAFYCAYNLQFINTMVLEVLGGVNNSGVYYDCVFYKCNKLDYMYLPNIKSIGYNVFYGSGIKKVVIGESLDSINANAIHDDIVIVGYAGSVAQTYAMTYGKIFIEIFKSGFYKNLQNSIDVALNKDCVLSIYVGGYDQRYEWYKNDSPEYSGEKIIWDNKDYLHIDTSVVGKNYYYVKITNWDNEVICSNICEVNIIDGFVILAVVNNGGEVSTPGEIIVERNSSYTYNFYPNVGYCVGEIYIDNSKLQGQDFLDAVNNGFTFENVEKDHIIEVYFDIQTFVISLKSSDGGNVNITDNTIVEYGDDLLVKFAPNEGYYTKSILINDKQIGDVVSYLISDIKCNYVIKVDFEIMRYNLSISNNYGGELSFSGEVLVEYGSNYSIEITPIENYGIASITINGESVEIGDNITIENITEDMVVVVTFAKTYKIEAISGVGGNISPTQMIVEGKSFKVDITPDIGYKVKNVIVDNIGCGNISSYTFADVSQEHSISVEFELQKFNLNIVRSGEGEVLCAGGIQNVEYGSNRVIEFTPEKGWKLAKVMVNGEEAEISHNKVTIDNITSSVSIEVEFEKEDDNILLGLNKVELIVIGVGVVLFGVVLLAIIKKIKSKKY